MPQKIDAPSVTELIMTWATKHAKQFQLIPIPTAQTDLTRSAAKRLKPGQSYFRVLLADVSLAGDPEHWKDWYPAVHASVRWQHETQEMTAERVTSVQTLVTPEFQLTGLIPFSEGEVEIGVGVLALHAKKNKFVENAVSVLSNFAELTTPSIRHLRTVSPKVASGVRTLMEGSNGRVHLSMYERFNNPEDDSSQGLHPGYIAVIFTPAGNVDSARLHVKENKLYYGSSNRMRRLRGVDYLLLRIEGREERDDWRLNYIQDPLTKAKQAYLEGHPRDAFDYSTIAISAACKAPDLVFHDRQRLALAIRDEFSKDSPRNFVRHRDLNQIMKAHGMTLAKAKHMPKVSMLEMLAHPDFTNWIPIPLGSVEASQVEVLKGGEVTGIEISKIEGEPESKRRGARSSSGSKQVETREAGRDQFQYKRINAWISDPDFESDSALLLGKSYELSLMVGDPKDSNLITGEAANIPLSDIPDKGLDTEWLIISSNVSISSSEKDVKTKSSSGEWRAEFSLHIPKEEPSKQLRLQISPQEVGAELSVIITAKGTLYRQFKISLRVDSNNEVTSEKLPVSISADITHVPGRYTGLRPPHEWQTPDGELTIVVFGNGKAHASGHCPLGPVNTVFNWGGAQARVAGPITSLRTSAEDFRIEFSSELDDIDPQDLVRRLATFKRHHENFFKPNLADQGHNQIWDTKIAGSPQLFDLAYYGNQLYETFFPGNDPANTNVRKALDSLTPGWRVNISWSAQADSDWVPNVPWGMIYKDPVIAGQSIDAMNFWGLRLRLNYLAHPITNLRPPALGKFDQTLKGYGMYWGNYIPEIANEASWQQTKWAKWANQRFVPDATLTSRTPKDQVLDLINNPNQQSMPVIYVFCQCNVGNGSKAELCFGVPKQASDNIRQTELALTNLTDQPLVFLNACTSAGSDPYVANQLEETFFTKGCRAYLGAEIKIPVRLASRFATIFYHFFYRRLDRLPMAAGEAVFQTRRFLWREYRNLGSLFYTYINQFELYMATDAELPVPHH